MCKLPEIKESKVSLLTTMVISRRKAYRLFSAHSLGVPACCLVLFLFRYCNRYGVQYFLYYMHPMGIDKLSHSLPTFNSTEMKRMYT